MYSLDNSLLEINCKYDAHKQLFDLHDNPLIRFLETNKSIADHLECSIKIAESNIFPNRYNLWFRGTIVQGMQMIKTFLDDQEKIESIKFNYELINSYLEKCNKALSLIMVFGVDLRADKQSSRYKIWFIYPNEGSLFSEIVNLYPQELRALFNTKVLLLGFDLGFDGSTKLKTYPVLTEELLYERNFAILESYFGARTGLLIRNSKRIHISKSGIDNFIIHFQPRDIAVFNECIQNKRYHEIIQSVVPRLISLNVSEIEKANIQNVNVYC